MWLSKLERYKNSFEYFLYDLRANSSGISYVGSLISSELFFSEEKFRQYFKFAEAVSGEEKLFMVAQQRAVGFSTFLALYTFYQCLYRPANIFIIQDAKLFRLYSNTVKEISLMTSGILKTYIDVNQSTKQISFDKSGATIRCLTDTTYEFNGFSEKVDLITFDNASLKNFEKLSHLLESTVQNIVADKIIMNFNIDTPENDIEMIKNLFKGKIKITENLK